MPDRDQDWHQSPAMTYEQMVQDHETRIRRVEVFVTEMRTAVSIAKWMFGASFVSGLLSIIALWKIVSGGQP